MGSSNTVTVYFYQVIAQAPTFRNGLAMASYISPSVSVVYSVFIGCLVRFPPIYTVNISVTIIIVICEVTTTTTTTFSTTPILLLIPYVWSHI